MMSLLCACDYVRPPPRGWRCPNSQEPTRPAVFPALLPCYRPRYSTLDQVGWPCRAGCQLPGLPLACRQTEWHCLCCERLQRCRPLQAAGHPKPLRPHTRLDPRRSRAPTRPTTACLVASSGGRGQGCWNLCTAPIHTAAGERAQMARCVRSGCTHHPASFGSPHARARSNDLDTVSRVTRELRCGDVWVNCYHAGDR